MLNNNKYEEEYCNLMNSLADSYLEASEEEIQEIIDEEGDNSATIRNVLLNAIKSNTQKKLREAREIYTLNLNAYQATNFEIPDDPTEKRTLMISMLGSLNAQSQSALTLQFRDFENMPDEDLDGVLMQLIALKSSQT